MKENLAEEVSIALLKEGFIVKTLKGAFDIVARDSEHTLLLKILEDANSISDESAEQMKKISSYLPAATLIIANKAGIELQDDVVYLRFGIYTLNFNTFKRCLENKFPIFRKGKAGITIKIDSERFRKERLNLGISIHELSKKIGVSRHMIQRYEQGDSEITLGKAAKVYKLFGENVFEKKNVLQAISEPYEIGKSIFAKKYSDLGFNALETKKVPFDLIAKKEKEIILTKVGDKLNPIISHISKLIDADRLVIFEKKKPKKIPAITKKEFLELEEANELIKFLKEFEE